MSEFLVIGHRGAMGHAPENTLRSVGLALELGVHGVEIDVHAIEDELIVFHDADLERTTNGQGKLAEKSFDYLRTLDAGDGEQIPTFREVLDLIDGRAFVNVELKGAGTAAPVVATIREYVEEKRWRSDAFLLSSFDEDQLREARKLDEDLRIGFLSSEEWSEKILGAAQKLDAYSLNLEVQSVSEPAVAAAHREGLNVFVFTVNSAEEAIELEKMGVNGVFSDFPDRILGRQDASARR